MSAQLSLMCWRSRTKRLYVAMNQISGRSTAAPAIARMTMVCGSIRDRLLRKQVLPKILRPEREETLGPRYARGELGGLPAAGAVGQAHPAAADFDHRGLVLEQELHHPGM